MEDLYWLKKFNQILKLVTDCYEFFRLFSIKFIIYSKKKYKYIDKILHMV